MNGQRITYAKRNTVKKQDETFHGTIIGQDVVMGAAFFLVRTDASGLTHNVFPQQIISR